MPIREQQTTNKQHAVPQNIMDVEFKIIGELTMRQFTYIAVFAVFAYIAKLLVPQPFTWFFVIGLGLTGLALAFVPVEDRGLDEWVVNFINAVNSPTEKIWRKETTLPSAFAYDQKIRMVQQELITLAPTASRRKLEEYLEQQGTAGEEDTLDIPEGKYIDLVREAFKHEGKSRKTRTEPKDERTQQEKRARQKEELQKRPVEGEETAEIKKPKIISTENYPSQEGERTGNAEADSQDKMNKLIRSRMKLTQIEFLRENEGRRTKLQPISEHAGRKFINLTPSQGQIILPIRGERILEPEKEAEAKYTEKSRQFQTFLNKSKQPEKKEEGEREKEKGREEEKNQGRDRKKEIEKPISFKQIPPMSNYPNIISGIIKDPKGGTLENIVVVIKNEKGEPVRALKTNKLGKFTISTPLSNGKYQIEIDKTNQTNLSFDIIPFRTEGKVLPSLEIIGR